MSIETENKPETCLERSCVYLLDELGPGAAGWRPLLTARVPALVTALPQLSPGRAPHTPRLIHVLTARGCRRPQCADEDTEAQGHEVMCMGSIGPT